MSAFTVTSYLFVWFLAVSFASAQKSTLHACASDWTDQQAAFVQASKTMWSNPSCYKFTFERICNCPADYAGPFEVTVQDGVIVAPARDGPSDKQIPTMDQIFMTIDATCFGSCPDVGPASCDATYGAEGYVASLDIDYNIKAVGEELRYRISDYGEC